MYSKTNDVEDQFQVTDLNTLFEDVVSDMEIKIEEKNVTVENLGLPHLKVVRFQFHQLFLNLLGNALKFSKTDTLPHVLIKSQITKGSLIANRSADKTRDYHHITISDNGIGFAPEYSEQIFDIFHRLHGRSQFEGTGIGLSICKKIVENHKGIMTADGKENEGATFHIFIPA
jgi:signal transduction histidine kinase